ncbi:MAG: hypothetical protein NC201_07645 [Prevotella sp.]|nr:hypothetical protein [Bacteroides sp.]MCM1367101.1 hypothetical protein [Prevotella sp.]MCM1437366.1 hypothetical protein [Prevotella sp.]
MKIYCHKFPLTSSSLILPVLFTLFLYACSDKKEASATDSDTSKILKDTIARIVPHTPDYILHQVEGDVESLVITRFTDTRCKDVEQADSVRFNGEGWWIGTTTWSGSGINKYVYSDIHIFYNEEGEFERGEDTAFENPLNFVVQRNDSAQIIRCARIESEDNNSELGYDEKWEWRGAKPYRHEITAWEYALTRKFKFGEENIYPSSEKGKTENAEGSITEEVSYKYTDFDPHGNWTRRVVNVTEILRDYDVNTGRIVQIGEPSHKSYVEKRRIHYR